MNTEQTNHFYLLNYNNNNKKHEADELVNLPYQ